MACGGERGCIPCRVRYGQGRGPEVCPVVGSRACATAQHNRPCWKPPPHPRPCGAHTLGPFPLKTPTTRRSTSRHVRAPPLAPVLPCWLPLSLPDHYHQSYVLWVLSPSCLSSGPADRPPRLHLPSGPGRRGQPGGPQAPHAVQRLPERPGRGNRNSGRAELECKQKEKASES